MPQFRDIEFSELVDKSSRGARSSGGSASAAALSGALFL